MADYFFRANAASNAAALGVKSNLRTKAQLSVAPWMRCNVTAQKPGPSTHPLPYPPTRKYGMLTPLTVISGVLLPCGLMSW